MKSSYNNLDRTAFNQLAKDFAGELKGGELIVLSSDLGGGKTTFTKALVKALGSDDNVSSPTFTIVNEYKAKFDIYHYDFYRLSDVGILASELKEHLSSPNNIVIIEWAEIVASLLPKEHILITITPTKEDNRDVTIER